MKSAIVLPLIMFASTGLRAETKEEARIYSYLCQAESISWYRQSSYSRYRRHTDYLNDRNTRVSDPKKLQGFGFGLNLKEGKDSFHDQVSPKVKEMLASTHDVPKEEISIVKLQVNCIVSESHVIPANIDSESYLEQANTLMWAGAGIQSILIVPEDSNFNRELFQEEPEYLQYAKTLRIFKQVDAMAEDSSWKIKITAEIRSNEEKGFVIEFSAKEGGRSTKYWLPVQESTCSQLVILSKSLDDPSGTLIVRRPNEELQNIDPLDSPTEQ